MGGVYYKRAAGGNLLGVIDEFFSLCSSYMTLKRKLCKFIELYVKRENLLLT